MRLTRIEVDAGVPNYSSAQAVNTFIQRSIRISVVAWRTGASQ